MYVRRQLELFRATGEIDEPSAVAELDALMPDVPARNVLALSNGKVLHGRQLIADSGTLALKLPQNYDNTHRLAVLVTTSKTMKATVVTPDLGTWNVMLYAGAASDQNGILSVQQRITSITMANSSGSSGWVEWFAFELPDLADADSWQNPAFVLGVLP